MVVCDMDKEEESGRLSNSKERQLFYGSTNENISNISKDNLIVGETDRENNFKSLRKASFNLAGKNSLESFDRGYIYKGSSSPTSNSCRSSRYLSNDLILTDSNDIEENQQGELNYNMEKDRDVDKSDIKSEYNRLRSSSFMSDSDNSPVMRNKYMTNNFNDCSYIQEEYPDQIDDTSVKSTNEALAVIDESTPLFPTTSNSSTTDLTSINTEKKSFTQEYSTALASLRFLIQKKNDLRSPAYRKAITHKHALNIRNRSTSAPIINKHYKLHKENANEPMTPSINNK